MTRREAGGSLWAALLLVSLSMMSWSCAEGVETVIEASLGANAQQKSQRTVADLRMVGMAMMSWGTDNASFSGVGGEVRDPTILDLDGYSLVSVAEVEALLVPQYIQELPTEDGWGHPLEYRVNRDLRGQQWVVIRSPGQDGQWNDDDGRYSMEGFAAADYDQDVVWADGYFVRWPQP